MPPYLTKLKRIYNTTDVVVIVKYSSEEGFQDVERNRCYNHDYEPQNSNSINLF